MSKVPDTISRPMRYTHVPLEARGAWWRPLIALGGTVAVWVSGGAVIVGVGRVLDGAAYNGRLGPWGFLANNVAVALALPLAVVVHARLFSAQPGSLASVQGCSGGCGSGVA